MDARKLSDAFEGIDEKYKMEADIFSETGKEPRRKGVLFPIFKGIVGAVAAVAVVVGLLWLGQLQKVPVGSNAASAGSGTSSQAVMDTRYTPLLFENRDERVAADSLAMPERGWARDLTMEQMASIWGEDQLIWDGLNVGEQYAFTGSAVYDAQGTPQQVWLSVTDQWQHQNGPGYLIEIELAPERLPVSCFVADNEPLSPTCTVYGTQVDARAPTDMAGNVQYFAVRFLKGGAEPVGVRARVQVENMGLGEVAARDLITRLVAQSLGTGNTLTLAGLASQKPEASSPLLSSEASLEDVAVEMAARYAEEIRTEFTQNATDGELQECRYQDLTIAAVREDRESMVLALTLVIKPTDSVATVGTWWDGNTRPGTGDLEGFVLADREVLLNRIDGVWQFGGDQTAGGITGSLGEEYQRMEESLGDQPAAE